MFFVEPRDENHQSRFPDELDRENKRDIELLSENEHRIQVPVLTIVCRFLKQFGQKIKNLVQNQKQN